MANLYSPPAGPAIRDWARKHQFSDWMVARWTKLVDDPLPLLEGLVTRPPKYMRLNPMADGEATFRRLVGKGFELEPSTLDMNVVRVRYAPISPGATTEHLTGRTTPQDLASASAGLALDAHPGEQILDMASAPGVKTLHIAQDMQDTGAIMAVEPDEKRMRALRFNLERCGVTNTQMQLMRGQDVPGEGWADRVLLDAPCTGEGTIPRDKKRRRGRKEEILQLASLQEELLDAADRALVEGGTLVYATCTLGPEENEYHLQRLIEKGYVMQDLPFQYCNGQPLGEGITKWSRTELDESISKARRFYPGIHDTLGFFVAKLVKEGP